MNVRVRSCDLKPGTVVRWRGCCDAVLESRKEPSEYDSLVFLPGWWLADNRGGLADMVIDDPDSPWKVVPDAE